MHVLVFLSISTITIVLFASRLDGFSYNDGSGELGNSLGYSMLYFCALLIGFVGWVLSVVVLIKGMRLKTKHTKYAALYVMLGIMGFSFAYYLMQAS